MRLLAKFNLVFLLVFVPGLIAAGLLSYSLLQRNARGEVVRNARLMMEAALAVRKYTNLQIKPLLNSRLRYQFLPQSVPAFAATENLQYIRASNPEFSYKEATLNPTNPRNLARGWELEIVKRFRSRSAPREVIGIRSTANGSSLYLGHPITVSNRACLSCHSTPSKAPPSMLKKYGTRHGFGWKYHDVIGAQIVSVPMSVPVGIANQAFKAYVVSLVTVFGLTILALNVMLRLLVIRPVTRLAAVADEISKGRVEGGDLPVQGQDEIATLTSSFNRMQRSLSQAMKMLDG